MSVCQAGRLGYVLENSLYMINCPVQRQSSRGHRSLPHLDYEQNQLTASPASPLQTAPLPHRTPRPSVEVVEVIPRARLVRRSRTYTQH